MFADVTKVVQFEFENNNVGIFRCYQIQITPLKQNIRD